jgi:hypothetical protein
MQIKIHTHEVAISYKKMWNSNLGDAACWPLDHNGFSFIVGKIAIVSPRSITQLIFVTDAVCSLKFRD